MRSLLLTLLHLAVVAARLCGPGGVRAVIAENLLLKHQLIVLRRARRRAPNLTRSDRLLCGFESLFLNPARIRKLAIALRPSTLLVLHRALVRRKYRLLFSSRPCPRKPGPKGPNEALIRAIVELKSRNPRFGCPRIANIISQTFGIDIDKNIVHRVLAKHYRPAPDGTGPSWLSFIGHTADSLWSVDLFRCESIVLRSYWVLVVMDQFTRRLVGVGVHCGAVTGADVCRMFNTAIHGQGVPRHLSTDHDPVFEAHRWAANLRILEIDEIKTVPHVPWSHPFVERSIGTMRREFLDYVLFWNGRDLERKLAEFQVYYNEARCHASLNGRTPLTFIGPPSIPANLNHVRWVSHCGDLVQLPVAA
jgi:transposase InsO family protein